MPKRRLYSESLHKSLTDETVEYVKAKRVEPEEVLYVTAGSFEDEDNSPDTIGFGKMIGTRFECMEEVATPAAGIRQRLRKTHHFLGLEQPVFRVEGGTSGDTLRGYLEGYVEEVGK